MPPPAVDSSFEVAFWFLDRAIEDGEYLQPQKLHRLLYLAQAYFGVLQNGLKLMPGMPVESFIKTEERTFVSYLTKPLQDHIAKAWNEK